MYNKILKIGIVTFGIFILCFSIWHILPIKKRIALAQNIEFACQSPVFSIGGQFEFRNPSTGGIRQYFCIDSNGNLYSSFAPYGILIANNQNIASQMAALPATGGIIQATNPYLITTNPFSGITKPILLEFGMGVWTSSTCIITGPNQWIVGTGPQSTTIQAASGFSCPTTGVIDLGNATQSHSSFIRDIGIDCNSIAACTGLVFDGAQNPSGAVNVKVSNFTADGVRLQQTTAATGGITLRDMWVYSVTGSAPSGSVLNVSQFSGTLLVENLVGQDDHSFPGAASFKVSGGSGQVTFFNDSSEGSTDQFLLTGTGVTTTIIGAGQAASSNPGVNTVHVGAGVLNYTLINVSQGNSTGAALVDDNRTYTCLGQITYLSITGNATKYDYGSCPTIGWIRTPATSVVTVDLIQLQSGFIASNRNYNVLDNSGNTQFGVTNDGRILFRGNQSGAFVQSQTSDVLTATRVIQHPNGPSTTVLVASLVTTAAASDNVAIQGMTSTGHCSLTATNAAAAAATLPSVTAKIANQITVTHAVTANMNYDIFCTSL